MGENKEKIDFVVTWVDGNDVEWQKEKAKYVPQQAGCDANNVRYRDMDTLKYWFRCVEKNAPWVNKIYFVTWGHLPQWLDVSNSKLNIVNHKDFIPEKYLPTFSSRPIELNMHRIKGLSDKFVYFNDDMFLLNSVQPEFFFKKGLPRDYIFIKSIYHYDNDDFWAYVLINDTWKVCNHFLYKKQFFKHMSKYINFRYTLKQNFRNAYRIENGSYPGFDDHHLASAYLKSTFEKVWDAEYDVLDATCMQKFRGPLNVNQYIFRYWQLAEGSFFPISKKKMGRMYNIKNENDSLADMIVNGKEKLICINDADIENYESTKAKVLAAFEKRFPEKSSFEKRG